MFAENEDFCLDDVGLGDEEDRRTLDKEVIVESNRDVYYNEGDDEVCSDHEETLKDCKEGKTSYPPFNAEVDFKGNNMSLGLKFPSNSVFRKALRYHAIESGYNYYYLHNGSTRVTVYCYNRFDCKKERARIVICVCGKEKKCSFKVHAIKLKEEEIFQIRTYIPDHSC